ncbi:hypothetical protein KP509_07G056700 [Ceratopteris richardii]|uniref:TFIIS central domain-containing protein n=1 Tax=Ceratopteris richardii TaxID=49495 RepID=A0A8T2UH08_CERRI|nr:hypothetical protein KP509_07G056700 [Ceratopteris richardii]KAH7433156.1 hypothetical protein KP509_07G056700 [Ceratopteris richardii]
MESQRETRRRSSKAASTPATPTPVRRRSARHAVEVQEKQENVVFAPSDPYSAAMDDMPLKDLFPNMKVRKRPTPKKVEVTEVSSPKNIESDESVRSKLRESLTSALKKIENVEWEHERGQDLKTDRENIEQTVSNNAAMKTEGQAKDQVMLDAELSEHALVKDNVEANIGIPESLDKLGRSLREERRDYIDTEGAPSKKVKLEFISDKTGDGRNQSETSDLAERVAFEIEAEMYRHFGGVNKKYKEKARSLLFNLKDRLNPELRLRVLAGEITPENLCSMTAEQLASKELSEWRMAKAEELAQMVVLTEADTEQTRLVKKTHKGEIELGFEKDDLLTDIVTVGSEQRIALLTQQQEREGTPVNAELDVQNDNVENTNDEILEEEIEVLNFSESPIRELDLADGISDAPSHFEELLPQRAEELNTSSQQEEESRSLPVKLSLDEFLGSKKVKEPNMSVKDDDELDLKLGLNEMKASSSFTPNEAVNVPFPIPVKDKLPRKPLGSPNHKSAEPGSSKNGTLFQKDRKKDHRLNEKLWEGSFQLSGSQISPVIAIFRSGDAVELQSWPKLIEIKGRVRLDALEKFLQELRLSRTRAVMVIACRVDGDEHVGAMNSLKEAAYQYQRGERVGYAEPVAGYELYLFPGGGSSLKLLIEHGYLNTHQVSSDEDDILIGFVVCRRSAPSGNVSHKTSHYFNANRHAISAQLDSPTRPSEIPSAGNVIKALPISSVSSKETDSYSAPLSFISTQAVSAPINIGESKVRPSMQPLGQEPGELVSLLSQPTQLVRPAQSGVSWMRKESVKDEDLDDDLPPGFGPKAWTRSKHSVPDDEDDGLPEYDFSTHNPPPVFTTMKSDVGLVPPFSVQTSYVQSSVFHPLSQGSQAPPGFEQQLNSQFFRPAIANATVPLDQARPPLPSSSQASQPLPFLPLGPRPPPGPPPGPSPPFTTFLPRPQLQSDGVIGARMPVSPQVPIAPQVPVVNVLGEGSFNLPQARPTSSQFYDESRRPPISFLQNHPMPISQAPSGAVRRRGGSQGNSLWDDDDMPEWCPPGISQHTDNIQTPSHLPLQSAESGPGSAPRGMGPLIGRGWQGMQAPVAVPLQGEGRGILQAPPPVMRFPVPAGGNGSHFPFVRPEKFSSDRPGTRLPEPRIFKSGK